MHADAEVRSDGPSPDTPRLLDWLDKNNMKSTFFVVGSRAISRPEILQYQYLAGHQIAAHTWAHPAMTSAYRLLTSSEANINH